MPLECSTEGGLQNPSCYLRDLDLYEGIPEEELIRFANTAEDRVYDRGEKIYTPEEPADTIYVITEGEVVLYHEQEGKKHIFDVLSPGSVFGHFQTTPTAPTHTAEATRRTKLCSTPVTEFLEIVREHPEIMLKFMKKMSDRIKDYEQKIQLTSAPAKERVLVELQRLERKRNENFFRKMFPKPLRVTHEEIAALTGLNRVTVTRAMKDLKEEKLIEMDATTGAIQFL